MNRFWRGIGFLAVTVLVGTSPVTAHSPHTGAVSLAAGESAAPSSQSDFMVTIQTFQFKPGQLEVETGTQVTWINQDDIRHTVTSGSPEKKDGKFDTPLAGKGTKFSFTFTQPGTYAYFCDRHQHMLGQIRVK